MRKIRDIKQRFDHNADLVYRRPVPYSKGTHSPGDPVPKDIPKHRLLRMWDAGYIELAPPKPPGKKRKLKVIPGKKEVESDGMKTEESGIVHGLSTKGLVIKFPDGRIEQFLNNESYVARLETLGLSAS